MRPLHHDRLGEHIERLAHHAHRGELQERAVHYLRQAGLKAIARSAQPDALNWFEQAQDVLRRLPESHSTLEQSFEICIEQRAAQINLGRVRLVVDSLREAGRLADKLNDNRRRCRVYALLANIYTLIGEPAEALAAGTQALALARGLELELRLLATSFLGYVYYAQAEYDRAVALFTENIATLPVGEHDTGGMDGFGRVEPEDRDYEFQHAGTGALISVWDRCFLTLSLAQLGRFVEAAGHAAEAIRKAEPTQRGITMGLAHFGACTLYLIKGEWGRARALFDRWITMARTRSVLLHLPFSLPLSAWVLAQLGEEHEALNRLRESEQVLEHSAAQGVVFQHGWDTTRWDVSV